MKRAQVHVRIGNQASKEEIGETDEQVVNECRIGGNKRWLWLMCYAKLQMGRSTGLIGLIRECEEEAQDIWMEREGRREGVRRE
jgi:hypothetical protein